MRAGVRVVRAFMAALGVAQGGDDAAHPREQVASEALGLHHMIVHLPRLGDVAGDFELQPERGQLVAPGIMQLARNAKALGIADISCDRGLRCPELPVRPGQSLRSPFLAAQRLRHQHAAELEHAGQRDEVGHVGIGGLCQQCDDGDRLEGDPTERFDGRRRHGNLPSDDDEEQRH